MRQTTQVPLIALSVRIYRALLIFYPAAYRREYGGHMVQVFRDMSRDSYHERGLLGMALWWCSTLLDLTITVFEQRRKVKFTMSKANFARLAPSLLAIGGAFIGVPAIFSLVQMSNQLTDNTIVQVLTWLLAPGFILIGLGCISLAWRYDNELGVGGRWSLYLTAIGAIAMSAGAISTAWDIWNGGGILHTLALTAFGFIHVRKPVLPVFRALPLQIAGGFLFLLLGFPALFPSPFNELLAFLFLFGAGLAWTGIGLALIRQQRDAALAAA